MRLFDTLSRRKRDFTSRRGKSIGIYTCGPSVYAYSHIGNFRTYVFEDVLVRYLRYKGLKIRRVMNITDIEDKAVQAARKEGVGLSELQEPKIKAFLADWDALLMLRPEVVANASDHVPAMARLIARICEKGYCRKEKDGIYFDVRKFKSYGKLGHIKNLKYMGKSANDDYSKRGLWDFRLWKKWTPADRDARWESPLGPGRPGWHIECSAISMRYLGEHFDIHCGGSDNIFPHHENEIAQDTAATGKPPADFWLHAKHLTLDGEKMSKRTGNVLYVSDLAKAGLRPVELRFYLMSAHYRKRLDFSMPKFRALLSDLQEAKTAVRIVSRLAGRESRGGKAIPQVASPRYGTALAKKMIEGFESAMDDDLNTRLALKRVFRSLKVAGQAARHGKMDSGGAKAILVSLEKINSVLAIF